MPRRKFSGPENFRGTHAAPDIATQDGLRSLAIFAMPSHDQSLFRQLVQLIFGCDCSRLPVASSDDRVGCPLRMVAVAMPPVVNDRGQFLAFSCHALASLMLMMLGRPSW